MSDKHPIVSKARRFAEEVHAGQFQHNATKDRFITHPWRVVELVELYGGTDLEIASAWLHDAVEDTPVTLEDIRAYFGDDVAHIVDGLTDPPHYVLQPDEIRKAWQAERVKHKHPSVKRVKIADQTVNTYAMGFDPPIDWDFGKRLTYINGARAIAQNSAGIFLDLDAYFEQIYGNSHTQILKEINS